MIALGNSRRAEAVPALKTALTDKSPLVREHAEWALDQVASPRVQQPRTNPKGNAPGIINMELQ
jgi:HEAT repeat protein